MNNNDFAELCRFIYGYGWQDKASEKLGINKRTIQYWSSGDKKVPDNIAGEVLALAANRLIGIQQAQPGLCSIPGLSGVTG